LEKFRAGFRGTKNRLEELSALQQYKSVRLCAQEMVVPNFRFGFAPDCKMSFMYAPLPAARVLGLTEISKGFQASNVICSVEGRRA
jgi:hypothetical protein